MKLTVDVDKKKLDEVAAQEIADLKKKLRNVENREKKLKAKISEMENDQLFAEALIEGMAALIAENAFHPLIEKYFPAYDYA